MTTHDEIKRRSPTSQTSPKVYSKFCFRMFISKVVTKTYQRIHMQCTRNLEYIVFFVINVSSEINKTRAATELLQASHRGESNKTSWLQLPGYIQIPTSISIMIRHWRSGEYYIPLCFFAKLSKLKGTCSCLTYILITGCKQDKHHGHNSEI